MENEKRKRRVGNNEAQAKARRIRVSPQKLNLVASTIRGKAVSQAIDELNYSRRRIAHDVLKCVMSATANAENNHDLDVDSLVVQEAYVGNDLVMKRFRARARGRGDRILKRFSSLTITLREVEKTRNKSPASKRKS